MAFGPDVTENFLQTNNLELVIRSHEVSSAAAARQRAETRGAGERRRLRGASRREIDHHLLGSKLLRPSDSYPRTATLSIPSQTATLRQLLTQICP